MRFHYLSCVLLLATVAVTLAQDRSGRSRGRGRDGAGDSSTDRYAVLSERNIFLKERHARREPSSRPASSQPVLTPEQSLVLRGVVLENDELRAYFEDLGSASDVVRVAPGEPLRSGRVVEIGIDAVAFERDGQLTWIEVGQDLTGAVSTARGSVSSSSSATTGTSVPASGNLSIEERLRLRRQQETNRR